VALGGTGAVVGVVTALVAVLSAGPDQPVTAGGLKTRARATGIVVIAFAVVAFFVSFLVPVATDDRMASAITASASVIASLVLAAVG
jgi:hypothetical protein